MQYYPNYYQTIANQEANIQRQIEGLTQQLQQTQALRQQYQSAMQQSYTQQPQQMIQPQQPHGITVQIIDDFSELGADDVPVDKIGSFFYKSDGSEIQFRKWSDKGEIVPLSFFPEIKDNTINSSDNNEKSKTGLSEDFAKTFNAKMQSVMDRLDMLEDIVNNKPKRSRKKDIANEISDSATTDE